MSAVVVDSNFLVALLDAKDIWHSRAQEIESALPKKAPRLFLDIVVGESVSVIARRCEEQQRSGSFARIVTSLRAVLPPSRILWISSLMQSYYDDVLEMMTRHSGSLNFNDCLVALFMKRNTLTYLASFDRDFDSLTHIERISSAGAAAKLLI
jgi:predicted nucleic acid-binding protein